jgi:hypothetical protein
MVLKINANLAPEEVYENVKEKSENKRNFVKNEKKNKNL